MASESVRIQFCRRLQVAFDDCPVQLPAKQSRVVFAFLVLNRTRAIPRQELIELVWPGAKPAAPGASVSVLLSRLRRALGPGSVEGRVEISVDLPGDVWIDVEAAAAAVDDARSAVAARDWGRALSCAQMAAGTLDGEFLPGHEEPWVEDRRNDLREVRAQALEYAARAALELGGDELVMARGAARELIATAPFREEGYRLLMEAYAGEGNVAEALLVYETLRALLRDELGAIPAGGVKRLHERLLAPPRR